MRRKDHGLALLFLVAALAVFCAGSAFAVPEVSEQEPKASQELWGGLFSRIAGTDWDGLKNAVLEARRDGKTSVTVLLNEETFREFTETQRLWYHAGQAGVMDAECSYRPGGRIWLNNIQWWPWPMYLVESREEFAQAVQQAESAHTFGMLLNETLYGELLGNDRERNRLECLSGLVDYSDMYYSDDHCAVWYLEPETAEVTPLEAEGVAGECRLLASPGEEHSFRRFGPLSGAALDVPVGDGSFAGNHHAVYDSSGENKPEDASASGGMDAV